MTVASAERKNMTGKVYKIEDGLVWLLLENGQHCWFQPIGSYEIAIGDTISGDLWSLDGELFFNATKNYEMSVFVEGHAEKMPENIRRPL